MKRIVSVASDGNRIVFLDYLRAIACLMVMAIHACEPFYLGGESPNVTHIASRSDMIWIVATECLCRSCVPLFAIASSYLLFPVRGATGAFFKRRLVRVGLPFIIWSLIYVAIFGTGGESFGHLLFNFPDEGGHLWFVPMLLGLYIFMPLLSPWAERVSERELKGWLAIWLATTSFPFIRRAWSLLWGDPAFGAVPYLWGEAPWNHFGMFHYISGFAGYLLMGLWFRRFAPELSWRRTISIAVPSWVAGAAIMGWPLFLQVRTFPLSAPYGFAVTMETSIEYCSLGVALATFATFLVIRKLEFAGFLYRRIVRPVAEASYGMYLMHMLLLPVFFAGFRAHMATPLAIGATAAVTFATSAVAAVVLRRIPVVGKAMCGG